MKLNYFSPESVWRQWHRIASNDTATRSWQMQCNHTIIVVRFAVQHRCEEGQEEGGLGRRIAMNSQGLEISKGYGEWITLVNDDRVPVSLFVRCGWTSSVASLVFQAGG